jgi:xyloglucan-specific exo-beta-1,4-glucanase
MPKPLRSIMRWMVGFMLASALVWAEAYKWDTVVMGGGGFVSAVIEHPTERNLFYARTDVGGAYRWQEEGERWIPLTDWLGPDELSFMGVESLAVDVNDPDKVYMAAGTRYWNGGRSAILRSKDRGATWDYTDVTKQFRISGNSFGRQSGEKLVVDPGDGRVLFFGTRGAGLFRSEDAGVSWRKVESFPEATTKNGNGVVFVWMDPARVEKGRPSPVIFAAISRPENNLFFSRDGGASWKPVKGAPKGVMPQRFAYSPERFLFITYANGAGPHGDNRAGEPMSRGEVWRLNLRDGNWKEVSPAGNRAYSGVAVSAARPKQVVVTTINNYSRQPWGHGDRIFVSSDLGGKWSDIIEEKRVDMDDGGFPWIRGRAMHWNGCITLDPFDADRAFLTSGNGIFMTRGIGAERSTWKFAVRGLEETVPIDVVSIEGGPTISVILDYDGFLHDDVRVSPPHGSHEPMMGSVTALAVAAKNPRMVARAGGKLQISSDMGRNWTVLNEGPIEKASGGSLAWSADGRVLLWSPSRADGIYRSEDRGMTWTKAEGPSFRARVFADAVNPERFFFYHSPTGDIWVSKDGGRRFEVVNQVEGGGSDIVRPVPGREGHFWMAMNRAGLQFSRDGVSVAKVESVDVCAAVGLGKPAPGSTEDTIFIWGRPKGEEKVGVYRSTDSGASWVRVNDDAHEYGGLANGQFVVGDRNVFGRVYMSTAGRGIAFGEPAE